MWYKIKKIYLGNQLVRPTYYEPGIYHNTTEWLISLSTDGSNWVTIADKNLWATTVYNSWNSVNAANAWNFYQRWNNYAFPYAWASNIVTTQTDASAYWPWNYYSSSTFRSISSGDAWDSSHNANLWWDTTNTFEARQWPCSSWWHVPSISEWFNLLDMWTTLWAWWARAGCWTNLINYLKLPIVYLHEWATPYTFNWWFICSSFGNYNSLYQCWDQLMMTSSGTCNVMNTSSVWVCLRPFKNVKAVPNSWWTKLYWPS